MFDVAWTSKQSLNPKNSSAQGLKKYFRDKISLFLHGLNNKYVEKGVLRYLF